MRRYSAGSMPNFFGHDVRLAFARKRTLRVTRRAHVAAGEFIGVDVFFFDVGVGNPVRPRSFVSADEKTLRAVSAVSTAVKNIFHLMSDQYAVFFTPVLTLIVAAWRGFPAINSSV